MKGVFDTSKAIEMAENAGLDLVEVSPNADPPVCKILDYGKYKYEQQKKAAEARKKQKVVDLKEIKLTPRIGKNDFDVKMRKAREFLEDGDKVKFTMRFRGREMAHLEIGQEMFKKIAADFAEVSQVDFEAKFEGRQMMMILAPKS